VVLEDAIAMEGGTGSGFVRSVEFGSVFAVAVVVVVFCREAGSEEEGTGMACCLTGSPSGPSVFGVGGATLGLGLLLALPISSTLECSPGGVLTTYSLVSMVGVCSSPLLWYPLVIWMPGGANTETELDTQSALMKDVVLAESIRYVSCRGVRG
jgi:hypothetical protein